MQAQRYGLPLAMMMAVAAVGTATLFLRPRASGIEPVSVRATAYFSASEIGRAHRYRGPQLLLGVAGLGISGGLLALVALRPPRALRRAIARADGRPLVGAAAIGVGLSLSLVAATLPFGAAAHQRALDVGLSNQDWGSWLGDATKSGAISSLMGAFAAVLTLALMRRFPRQWWAPAAACAVVLSAAFVFLSPIALEPLFNRFTPLPAGKLRSDVFELASRAGVDIGEVYRVDASRRTSGANAYIAGLGRTRRVVIYDNLIERFPPAQLRSVVAHELAHVRHRDLLRGLAWLAIVAPAGMLLVQRLAESIQADEHARRRAQGWRGVATPAMLPSVALAVAIVSFAASTAANATSRRVEASADAFALGLTRDPQAAIRLEQRLTVQNVSEPDPPALAHALFGTHPTALERIGAALVWARREGRASPPETPGGS